MMDWSFQLYSARNFKPWSQVVETLGKLGYSQVEGFGGVYEDPEGFRTLLDRNGIAMPSGHFGFAQLNDDLDGALSIAKTLGMKLVACPHIDVASRPSDAEGWKRFGEQLGAIGKRVEAEGYRFAWHNHDFEFQALADGSLPQTHLLDAAPDLGWEMDVAWVIKGGGNVDMWIDKYADRIVAVHVKDIAKDGEGLDEDGWSDVGHGTVNWKALVRQFREKTPAQYFVMEQDNPNDFERFARRSIETVQAF